MMTDEELAQAGERLYASLLLTDLSVFEIGGLTAAIRTRTKWPELAPGLKVAVFRIVANAQRAEQPGAPPSPEGPGANAAPAAAPAPVVMPSSEAAAADESAKSTNEVGREQT